MEENNGKNKVAIAAFLLSGNKLKIIANNTCIITIMLLLYSHRLGNKPKPSKREIETMTKSALKKEIKMYMNVGLNFEDACQKVNNNHLNKYLSKIFQIQMSGSL